MWDLSRSAIKLVSPALQSRFATTGPPRRALHLYFKHSTSIVREDTHFLSDGGSDSVTVWLFFIIYSWVPESEWVMSKEIPFRDITRPITSSFALLLPPNIQVYLFFLKPEPDLFMGLFSPPTRLLWPPGAGQQTRAEWLRGQCQSARWAGFNEGPRKTDLSRAATPQGLCGSYPWRWECFLALMRKSESECVSRSVLSDSLRPHGLQPSRLLCLRNSPGKSTGVGCHSLLQGVLPTQGSNLGLLHGRQIPHHVLNCKGGIGSPGAWPPSHQTHDSTVRARLGVCLGAVPGLWSLSQGASRASQSRCPWECAWKWKEWEEKMNGSLLFECLDDGTSKQRTT